MSFWVHRAPKIQTPSHQADIAKTYENLRFLLILEGWRLDNAHFGSLGELLAWVLAAWMAADPSRPSPLNIILRTPSMFLFVFVLMLKNVLKYTYNDNH